MAKTPLDVESLKPNSRSYREAQQTSATADDTKERLAPVVGTGGVVSTKKPIGKKFVDAFVSEDAPDIKSYILGEVIIPTIKNGILDVMQMIFFGGSNVRSYGRSSSIYRDQTPYHSYYASQNAPRTVQSRRDEGRYQENTKVDYRNIILRERRDAEEIVDKLKHRIDIYRQATIADLFDLIDVDHNYVDNNWGWDDVRDIGIRRVGSGFLIDVAEAKHLD